MQRRQALTVVGSLLGGALAAGLSHPVLAGELAAEHPHIHKAIEELKESKHDLESAKHDFGGHRAEAIKAIDGAIVQLEVCLKHVK